jgi:hypothetical protein
MLSKNTAPFPAGRVPLRPAIAAGAVFRRRGPVGEGHNAADSSAVERAFDAQMSAAVSEVKVKEVLAGLRAQLGKIQNLGTPQFESELAVYPVHFERGMLDMKIALDAEGKIGGLLLVSHANTDIPVHENRKLNFRCPSAAPG